jgi:hypothetical protein
LDFFYKKKSPETEFLLGTSETGKQSVRESLDFTAEGTVGMAGLWRGGDLGQDGVMRKGGFAG